MLIIANFWLILLISFRSDSFPNVFMITCLLQQILYLCHSGVCHCSNKRDTVIMVGMGGRRYSKCRYFEYRDLLNVAFQEDSIHALYNILGFHGNM